jgi:UDP:flavonoid glycosyltransferase YjiC (YdhE family)
MARVLLALELGGGYGHWRRLRPVARLLAAAGHAVRVACPEDAQAGASAAASVRAAGLIATPAPVAREQPGTGAMPDSFAEILLRCGWGRVGELGRLVAGWRAAFAADPPDIVVADFAPTALLAAGLDGIARLAVGTGFAIPPATTPLPSTRAWDPAAPDRLAWLDRRVTTTVGAVWGAGAPASLAALFGPVPSLICTFPELDHYPDRGGEPSYVGPIWEGEEGEEPVWPAGSGARGFAYLSAAHPGFAAAVAAMAASGARWLLHPRGLGDADAAAIATAHPAIRVSRRPVRLAAALEGAALVLCQGLNTASAALAAGCPVMLLPEHLEQVMIGHQVVRQGLGGALLPPLKAQALTESLRSAAEEGAMRAAAAAFARRYHGFRPAMAAEAVADAIETAAT